MVCQRARRSRSASPEDRPVPAQTPVQQLVTVQNTGDRPLAGLQTALQGAAGTEAVGFTIQSPCTGELASGATCNVGIQFLPADAAVYSAVLRLAGDSAVTSALLLGRAFPRGSLTLTPVDGSEDFGDVALGSPRTIQWGKTATD